jgi:membrane-bound ClpP family serine protease
MSLLAIAFLLFLTALVVFVIDLMIPSGGILVGVTACLAFAAVVFAFRYSFNAGVWMLITSLGSIPVMMWLFISVWPKTPLGKKMIAKPDPPGTFVWSDAAKSGDGRSLVGAEGTALQEMLPSGLVKIGEQTFEAFSESGPIDAGKTIRVVRLDVGRLVVVVVRNVKSTGPMSDGTGLDRPISDLNIESLDG